MTVDFKNVLEIPSFAFIVQHEEYNWQNPFNYSTSNGTLDFFATLGRRGKLIRYPRTSLQTRPLPLQQTRDDGEIYWVNRTVFVANSAQALRQNTTSAPTATNLILTLDGTYNSSVGGRPSMEFALFDARLQMRDMLDCGLVPWTQSTPFSTSFMSMTMMQIANEQRTVRAPSGSNRRCTSLYRQLLSQTNPRFAFYEPRLTASVPNVRDFASECDVVANPNATCATTIYFEYGNQFVLTRETRRGTTTLDIWTDAGALVGAVQFFAWFWLQAVGS